MKSSLWLRVAALITGCQAIGHLVARPWTPGHDIVSIGVVAAMKAHEMNVMGFERSYFDFYVGFGIDLAIFLGAQAILLWLLAAFASTEPGRARPAIAVFFTANLAITAISAVYLFTAPLVMTGLVVVSLGIGMLLPVTQRA